MTRKVEVSLMTGKFEFDVSAIGLGESDGVILYRHPRLTLQELLLG